MDETLGAESGARPDTPVFLILLTDGKSQDDAVSAGNRLKATGVEIIGIGQRPHPVMSHPVHICVAKQRNSSSNDHRWAEARALATQVNQSSEPVYVLRRWT